MDILPVVGVVEVVGLHNMVLGKMVDRLQNRLVDMLVEEVVEVH